MRRPIRQSHSSIVRILAGRPMFASSPRDMLSMVLTVSHRKRLKTSHSSTISLTLILKREEKALSLERKEVNNLVNLWLKCSNGTPITPLLMIFQITWFQSHLTWDLSMDLISQIHWEIKVHVVLATQFPSLRLSSQDSNNAMAKRFLSSRLSTSWCAIISMKVAMAAGPSSTAS